MYFLEKLKEKWYPPTEIKEEVVVVDPEEVDVLDGIILVNVEKHDGIMFAYKSSSSEYVCHGKDLREMIANFYVRFPDGTPLIVNGEEKWIWEN